MSGDVRKDYITKILKNHFHDVSSSVGKSEDIDKFLDSGNTLTMMAYMDSKKKLHIDTKVSWMIDVRLVWQLLNNWKLYFFIEK